MPDQERTSSVLYHRIEYGPPPESLSAALFELCQGHRKKHCFERHRRQPSWLSVSACPSTATGLAYHTTSMRFVLAVTIQDPSYPTTSDPMLIPTVMAPALVASKASRRTSTPSLLLYKTYTVLARVSPDPLRSSRQDARIAAC